MSLRRYLQKHDLKADIPDKRVSTVAVVHGKHVLFGRRRDNGKHTTPGGHVDEGESFHDAALRELDEEAGIKASHHEVRPLGAPKLVKTDDGKTLAVQPFVHHVRGGRPPTSMKEDPDAEVHRWSWVDCSGGLPKHVRENLHVPMHKNALLPRLGL